MPNSLHLLLVILVCLGSFFVGVQAMQMHYQKLGYLPRCLEAVKMEKLVRTIEALEAAEHDRTHSGDNPYLSRPGRYPKSPCLNNTLRGPGCG